MTDSNETIAYENGRDAGYSEGYEDGLKQQKIFTEDDFSQDELMLLKMAFKMVTEVVEIQREYRYDSSLSDELYNLKEKLGIYDLVS